MDTAKCAKCNGEIALKGFGGKCSKCNVPYCRDDWNRGTYWCTVCSNELK